MPSLRLTESQMTAIFRHAESAAPEECCGVLLGSRTAAGGEVQQVAKSRNVADLDRCRHYAIDPLDLFAAHRRARQRQLEVLGYYHSHPCSNAQPSAKDLSDAWPSTSYLIVGRPAENYEARSWRLAADGRLAEELLVVLPDGTDSEVLPDVEARIAGPGEQGNQEAHL